MNCFENATKMAFTTRLTSSGGGLKSLNISVNRLASVLTGVFQLTKISSNANFEQRETSNYVLMLQTSD